MNNEEHETSSGPLIVFDGVCILCTRWVRFVIKHDHRGEFRFATVQSPAGQQLLVSHGLDPRDPASFLVLVDGQSYSESAGMLRVVSDFGGAWRAIKLLSIVPRPIRDWIYRFIARHRYRLFGKYDRCIVPDSKISARFVEDLDDLNSLRSHRQ